MKFSTTAYLAILTTAACVQAAPLAAEAQFSSEVTIVKKSDVTEIKTLLAELTHINKKRALVEDEAELDILQKRLDSALGNLLTALANSGILTDVIKTLTTDPTISASVANIVKAAVQASIANGPALLTAVWNSGLLGRVFQDFINDADLRNAVVAIIPELLQTGLSLLESFIGAPRPAAGGAKREVVELDVNSEEYLNKRDLASVVAFIVDEIKQSGILTSLINKILADPQASINFLTSALQTGVVVAEDLYNWAKQSGLLQTAINYLSANSGAILNGGATLLGEIFGINLPTPSTSTPSTPSAAAAPAAPAAATAAAPAVPASFPSVAAPAPVSGGSIIAGNPPQQGLKRRNY